MKKRIVTLDIIKFISAILIVFIHFQQVTGIRFATINFYSSNFPADYIVELFFMISGFLCVYSYIDYSSLCSFVYRKFRKIYLIALLSIVLIYIVEIINYSMFGNPIKADGLGLWTIFSSVTLTFKMGFIDSDGLGINNPLWYLSVLIICYVIFYMIKKCNKKYMFVLIPIISLGLFSNNIRLPLLTTSTLRGYISFFIGVLIFDIYVFINQTINKKKFSILLTLIILFVFILGFLKYDIFFDNAYYIYVLIIWPLIILLSLCLNEYIKCDKLKLLGNMSLEIYVWHSFLLKILITLNRAGLISYENKRIELMLLFTAIVVLFSLIFVKYIEKLVEKFSNKIVHYFMN